MVIAFGNLKEAVTLEYHIGRWCEIHWLTVHQRDLLDDAILNGGGHDVSATTIHATGNTADTFECIPMSVECVGG
jgi:hypothetical protein